MTTATPEEHAARIAQEEAHWTAPRLFAFGFMFLGACVTVIYILSCI